MRLPFSILLFILMHVCSFAQDGKGNLLVVCYMDGQVLVDGVVVASVTANKPLVHPIVEGDHLVQFICSVDGKADLRNEMVHVEVGKQKAVQFNAPNALNNIALADHRDTVLVADLNVPIPGALTVGAWEGNHKGETFAHPTYYYAFEKGDRLVLDVTMSNAKGTNSIEIVTVPDRVVRYSNRQFSALKGQVLNIEERCILSLKLATNHAFERNAFLKVRRIPLNADKKGFKTDVLWRTRFDSTYVLKEERVLVSSDTSIVNPIDQVAKISSQTAANGNSNRTLVEFDLPDHTVAWSYFIGVGQDANRVCAEALEASKEAVSSSLSTLSGFSPLVPLALTGTSYFRAALGEDNVKYWFLQDRESARLFSNGEGFYQTKEGDVVSEAAQMKAPLAGRVNLGLSNDNFMEAISVTVKVTAVVVKQQFENRTSKLLVVKEMKEAYALNP